MKKNAILINPLFFVLILLTLFLGCKDECDESDECLNRYRIVFEPVNSQGENLLLKPDSIYTGDSIRLLPASSSIDLSFTSGKIVLILEQSVNQFIIDFSKNKVDTFYLDKKWEESECCGKVIDNFSVSNQDSVLINNYNGNYSFKYIIP